MFSKDGEEEFVAGRDILTDGHLVVDVENKGDVLIPLDAIAVGKWRGTNCTTRTKSEHCSRRTAG